MFRVNVEGKVLALNADSLFDLLQDICSEMRNAVIVRCKGGYVIDSLQSRQSVLVNVTPMAGAA